MSSRLSFQAGCSSSKSHANTAVNVRACRAEKSGEDREAHRITRRVGLGSGISFLLASQGARAAGIEGIKPAESILGGFNDLRQKNKDAFEKGAEAFENSDILKTLRERTTANKETNRKALQERYCYRQAELGVGDCGGLRLIPGATKSGKQKTPEWLKGVLQRLGQMPPEEAAK